jgi:hypothetical protein
VHTGAVGVHKSRRKWPAQLKARLKVRNLGACGKLSRDFRNSTWQDLAVQQLAVQQFIRRSRQVRHCCVLSALEMLAAQLGAPGRTDIPLHEPKYEMPPIFESTARALLSPLRSASSSTLRGDRSWSKKPPIEPSLGQRSLVFQELSTLVVSDFYRTNRHTPPIYNPTLASECSLETQRHRGSILTSFHCFVLGSGTPNRPNVRPMGLFKSNTLSVQLIKATLLQPTILTSS